MSIPLLSFGAAVDDIYQVGFLQALSESAEDRLRERLDATLAHRLKIPSAFGDVAPLSGDRIDKPLRFEIGICFLNGIRIY